MLTDDQNERLTAMLENLDVHMKDLPERARDFVSQTIDRFNTYDKRLMLSDKQWEWLESLHAKYCADAPPLPSTVNADDDYGPPIEHDA